MLIGSPKWIISTLARKIVMQQGWKTYTFHKLLDYMVFQKLLPSIDIVDFWVIFRGLCGRKWGLNCSSAVPISPKQAN